MTETRAGAKAAAKSAATTEPTVVELGATISLSAAEAIADPNNDIEAGRPALWSQGGNAVALATPDLTGDTMDVVGVMLGRSRVSYAQKIDISADDAIAAATAGAKYTDEVHARHTVYWDVDVVPVGSVVQAEAAAAEPEEPPKVHAEPSAETPYGIGEGGEAVEPAPGMGSPAEMSPEEPPPDPPITRAKDKGDNDKKAKS
jgi:hypothetical protein